MPAEAGIQAGFWGGWRALGGRDRHACGSRNPGRFLGWVAGLGREGSSCLRKQESRQVFGVGGGPWGGHVMPAEAGIQAGPWSAAAPETVIPAKSLPLGLRQPPAPGFGNIIRHRLSGVLTGFRQKPCVTSPVQRNSVAVPVRSRVWMAPGT